MSPVPLNVHVDPVKDVYIPVLDVDSSNEADWYGSVPWLAVEEAVAVFPVSVVEGDIIGGLTEGAWFTVNSTAEDVVETGDNEESVTVAQKYVVDDVIGILPV